MSLIFQVRDIHIHPELFSVENGLLTPTFKTKRNDVRKYFADQIGAMYSKMADAIKSWNIIHSTYFLYPVFHNIFVVLSFNICD